MAVAPDWMIGPNCLLVDRLASVLLWPTSREISWMGTSLSESSDTK
jgi:hypothetical protein